MEPRAHTQVGKHPQIVLGVCTAFAGELTADGANSCYRRPQLQLGWRETGPFENCSYPRHQVGVLGLGWCEVYDDGRHAATAALLPPHSLLSGSAQQPLTDLMDYTGSFRGLHALFIRQLAQLRVLPAQTRLDATSWRRFSVTTGW